MADLNNGRRIPPGYIYDPINGIIPAPPAKKPFNTGGNILDTLGDLWDASKLQGLAPDMSAAGELPNMSVISGNAAKSLGLLGDEIKNSHMAAQLGQSAENYMSRMGGLLHAVPKEQQVASKVGSLIGDYPSTTAGRIINETSKTGGYSVHLPTGKTPTDGLMMGIYRNDDPRNMVLDKFTRPDVYKQAETNAKQLSEPDNYFGTWFNPDDSKTYLDVSKRFEPGDIRKATKFGEKTGQLAGFDRGAFDTFPVGNWSDFIRSPEYNSRLSELNQAGVDYLKQHPTVNWWDLHGTDLENIYGKEKLPNVAGYLAATSPVSDVPRNARIASEYMRRHIAGEPIIQPDFRMPDNAVFETPGNMMPMETGRKNNLLAASEGRIDDLSKEKVRNMGKALLGDPNAMVFDRHWANLSEKPVEGVYTGPEKGVFPSGKQYSDLETIVANQAKEAGLSPRDFSANVWTGYRNKAQQGNEVYGQKTAGAGIQGESKSIADTYLDLIKSKAQKLNIPYDEMLNKLKAGEMSLLSLLPVGFKGGLLADSPTNKKGNK